MHSLHFRSLEVRVPSGDAVLEGDLTIPDAALGLVIFAHGSGSSRHSPRNRSVAELLRKRGLATLLFDLLTAEEAYIDAQGGQLRFNIPFLTTRLVDATRFATHHPAATHLRPGYFGASTGAAAALAAAARMPEKISAVVSRGGRSDLVDDLLSRVKAPVLFIAGGEDRPVIQWNEQSMTRLPGIAEIEIIPGADHLFTQPGTLAAAASLAADWFCKYLSAEE